MSDERVRIHGPVVVKYQQSSEAEAEPGLLDARSPLLPRPMMAEMETASQAHEKWRRWVGLGLLLLTVLLWTTSNFLASVRLELILFWHILLAAVYSPRPDSCATLVVLSETIAIKTNISRLVAIRQRFILQTVPRHIR